MSDTKIFIDTDEEITFLVEKIKHAATQNVVVIVPDRASIFITSASLRLLKKAIDKLDKKVILVTMDEYGKKLADNIDFTNVSRVRDVTPDIWSTVKKTLPKRSSGVKKNNVIRELPEEYKQLVEKEELVQEATDNTETVNASNPEELIQEKNIESASMENSETVPVEDTHESVLKSDEEFTLDQNLVKEQEENTEPVLDNQKEFIVPNFQKTAEEESAESQHIPSFVPKEDQVSLVVENVPLDEEDDLLFFEGEDIAEKEIKKKVLKSQVSKTHIPKSHLNLG